ncbi:MAG: hydrogenase 2 operon protein HybA [Candidatus Contendobacter sp.]|nr:hydrogenase 2 operon protein HybA [Candidatus Contendobacter sp.]MDS4056992.1 hydrogenase 2 operon protein HybA [Candidatus Contendobacter sp.]
MDISRRQFLRGAAGAVATVAAAPVAEASAPFAPREPKQLPPKAIGMLYDSTQCIGCKACVAACKEANGMPVEQPQALNGWNEGTWDTALDISGKTLNVIRVYQNGTMAEKDREKDGYAFVKRHCLHCVDPSCISVCPVSAMQKNPITGVVTYNPNACIGCRYCVYGCPFNVPHYQFDEPFGRISKCQFCSHRLKDNPLFSNLNQGTTGATISNLMSEASQSGRIPACCDVCPTGASLFGWVEDLQAEAKRRLALKPGEMYEFPRGLLGGDRPSQTAPVGHYQPHIYGEKEAGGTQVRYLTGVPHEKLGLPKLPDHSYAAISEGMQHTIYKGMVAPLALFGGLVMLARRTVKNDDENKNDEDRPS